MNTTTDLYSVYIGGLLALSGVAIGGVITFVDHVLERRHRRDAVLRAKYEEMTMLFCESLLWFPKFSACKTIEEIRDTQIPPEARKVAMLAMVYFPSLKDEAIEYVNALVAYQHWGCDCFKNMPASLGAMMAMDPDHDRQNRQFDQAKAKLDDAITRHARKYTRA